MTQLKQSDVVWKAVEILQNAEWLQGSYGDEKAMCASGAFRLASGKDLSFHEYTEASRAVHGVEMCIYNDTVCKTKEDAVNGLKAIAAYLQADGR